MPASTLDDPKTVDLDRRSALYRRFARVSSALVSDQGGDDHLTEARKQLVDRASFLAARLSAIECAAPAGEEIDLQEYGAAADRLRRILAEIGLERGASAQSVRSVELNNHLRG